MKSRQLINILIVLILLANTLIPASLAMVPDASASAPAPELPAIRLKARTIEPVPGLDKATAPLLLAAEAKGAEAGGFHALVQLDHIPTAAEKEALAARGLHLQAYLPERAWVVRVDTARAGLLQRLVADEEIAWAGALLPMDKLDPVLTEYLAQPSDPEFHGQIAVAVQFHGDVSLAAGRELLKRYGARITGEASVINVVVGELDRDRVDALSREDAVLWLELPTPHLTPTNSNTRARTNVDNIQDTAPYNLNGDGVDVLVFDTGRASHPDYNGRIIGQDTTDVTDHASHVAGTVLGDGAGDPTDSVLANRGMAPGADLITYGLETDGTNLFLYDNPGDVQADFQNALNLGADIATASLGTNLAGNGQARINAGLPVGVFSCNREGDYPLTSQLLDDIVRRSLGEPLIMTWAAGNERGDGRCGVQYNTTAPPATAKNPIQVGATNQNNDGSANFSGWGPTDDGRLKPVISAPGVNVLSTIPNLFIDNRGRNCINNPADPNDGDDYCWPYDTMSGTSMATPAVAGIVALMLEQFRDSYNTPNNLLPATVKALLMNTAADGNGVLGPDFETGYGRVDAQAAVDTIMENRFASGELANTGDVDRYFLEVEAGDPLLQVSLAWDDAPGTILAATELVNDLDLRLIEPDGATTWQPWVLDPTAGNEANNPTRGNDNLNNQEQVIVQNPTVGWWTVEVRGTSIPESPQTYGLALTHNPWTFSLEYPTTAQPADAGYFAGPSKFLVRLRISDGYRPSTNITGMDPFTELQMFVRAEEIGVDGGAIVHYGPVGNEYHLVVRAPAQAADGSYDFTVEFMGGTFTETETDAVEYQSTPSDPKAMALVLDRSGSMSYDDKLEAAKNAGRDFIFMSEIGDAIAQVKFNEASDVFQSLTDVAVEADLTTFANNLNPITADGWTGIGGAVKKGYGEIEPDSRLPNIVLLSDGRENRDPLWGVAKEDIPTNVPIHTVAVGPDADTALMAQIADRHDGDFHEVPTGAGVMMAMAALAADVSVADALPNRLADVYQFISNEMRDYERLAERAGDLNSGSTTTFDISIQESVPWLFFTTNWASSSTSLLLKLRRPDGVTYVSGADVDATFRSDVTSQRFRMASPAPGTWRMEIKNSGASSTEYLATVEGPADTDLMMFTPSLGECRPTKPERICAGFVGRDGYVSGAQTFIAYLGEKGQERSMIEIEPGFYCTSEELYFPEGASSVKVEGSGVDEYGKPIQRIERKSFYCGDLDVPPILLVNDVMAYQGEFDFSARDTYMTALDAIGVEYDVWNTQIDGPPSASVLDYDTVIWLTARDDTRTMYEGRSTLDPDEEAAVKEYLEHDVGDVFLLSSQGYLDTYGLTPFGKDVLGVDSFISDVASASVRGMRDTALGHGFGEHPLASPYDKSSDVVEPGARADANFVNQDDRVIGVTHPYGEGCTAFFPFALEGLPSAQLESILEQSLSDNWQCAPVDIVVDTSGTTTSVSLEHGQVFTDTFTIENPTPNVGFLEVELNNGPTHLWLLTDGVGDVPDILAPYDLGDLPSPLASVALASALDPNAIVSRVCQISTGLGDCCSGGTCTDSMLLDNDVAVVWNNTPFADPTALGDMLADFVDLGGTVLLAGDALIQGPAGLQGRFASEAYSPLVSDGSNAGSALLGSIETPGHPLIDDVSNLSTSDHLEATATAGDVTVHALWDSSEPVVATRIVHPGTSGQVIAINASLEDLAWSLDLDDLVANALGLLDESWRYPGWFDLACSQTPPAESGDVPPIVFDNSLTCPDILGGVSWQVGLRFDSNFAPEDALDPVDPPQYKGKIAIAHSAMGRDRVNVPISMEVLSAPLPERPENPSFTVAAGSPLGYSGADILMLATTPGFTATLAIPAANLGLAFEDDIDALSYGLDGSGANGGAEFACLDFEDLTLGTTYHVTDTFVTSGITVTATAFQWSGGAWTSDGFAEVENGGLAGGSGQEMEVNNINLEFDFGGSISGLELRFGEYGGNLNVEINGDFQNFGNFADIHGSTIGGVNVSVVNGLGNDQGMLTLEGAIDSFAIGGQELWIDDVCPPEEEEENGEVLNFSVQPGAAGRPGTAVEAEAACDPAEAAGDEFVVTIPGQNEQVLDEDGNACGANAGYPLGLTLDDNLDALNGQPPEHIYDPDEPVYFSLTSGSPSLSVLGATEADILVNQAYTTSIFASGEELGLQAGDDVDAMMLLENGNGYFDPATAEYPDGDRLVFSLAAGSTTLTDLGRSSAALLVPNKGTPGGPPAVAFPALLSGLAFEDDLNALKGDAYFLWRLAPFPEEPPTPEPSGCEVNPIGGPEGWNSRTSLPVGREGGFAVIIGNRIYVGQGLSAFGDDSFHFIYHIPTDTWHWAAPAPIGRAEVTGVCAEEEEQGKVFVFGGRSSGAALDHVLVYDPLTDSWSARAPMPTPRVGMGAAWAPPQNPGDPSLIYVIGGRDGTIPHSGTPMDVVEAYDVVSGTWSTMAPMPVPMMDVYSTVYYSDTHKIYVIGGYDGSNVSGKVQIYDVGSDSWSTGASMPTPRSNLLAGLCEGRIHAIGGYDGTNEFAVNEAYDPSTNTWSTAGISPLPEPRSEFMTQGIFTGQDIYAIGDGIHGVGGGPHDVYTCGTAEPPVISDVRITNVRDTSFTVSWITDISSDGHVNYGTDPANLNQTAYDDRGADTFDDTHHVTLQELLPNTLYYFDVVSGATTDDNDGAHYTVTTGPTLGLPGSDQIFGQVFKEDGTTPAEGAIVYITLRDADGSGSPDEAATLSALVDDTGYWTTNLGNARLADLSGYFTYSASGDQVKLEAQGAAGGTGCLLVDTADDSPAADLILNVSTCLVEKEIPLQIGWNHISLPLDPLTSYTAEGVCDEIISQGGDVAEIDRWYASGWDGHICGLPFNDFDLELGSDYFIRSNAASTWSIEGYSVTTPVPLDLQIGWNSIGVPHCDTYTAESLCEEIIGQGVTAIEIDRWYASGWDGHICGLPFNDFPIEIGKGYFVKAASAGLVTPTCPALSTLASPLALAQEAPLAARKAQVRIENVQMTNLRDTSFAVSWTTDRKATGYLEFADGRVVYDVRGKGFAGETHYVVVTGLTPKTTYLFDIDSGATLDDKAGKHHTITTLPTLDTLPDSDVVYGQVFLSDGVPNEFGLTLAEGAIVYLTLADRDGQGSAGEAAVMSALVDAGGWWQANLGNARLADGSDVFAYSAFGDVVTLAAQGTGVGLVIQTMDTGDLRPAAPLSPDWQFQTYLPLIGR